MQREILMEAADMLAKYEHMSKDYILAVYSPREIFQKIRKYREEREANMDAVRSNW